MRKAFWPVLAIQLLSLASNVVSADERIVLQRDNFGTDRDFIERYVVGNLVYTGNSSPIMSILVASILAVTT